MLQSSPTKFGAGITLIGDYKDFSEIRETVYQLAGEDQGSMPSEQSSLVMALACEARHAAQGDRRPSVHGEHEPPSGHYYEVDILWPIFLTQLGMLRTAAGYQPTNRSIQASLYRLEACAESALLHKDPAVGSICMRWVSSYTPLPRDFLSEFVSRQSYDYLFGSGKDGAARYRRLPSILEDISIFSSKYKDFERLASRLAAEQGCRPQDLYDQSEWPEFRW